MNQRTLRRFAGEFGSPLAGTIGITGVISRCLVAKALVAGTLVAATLGGVATARANGPLEKATPPGPNRADEAKANKYSLDRAVQFLDNAALTWQKSNQCFTCHTNFAYLYARPMVDKDSPELGVVRAFAERMVKERWPKQGPRWDAEVVATAAALAFYDQQTTQKLGDTTRAALDKMWTLQKADGSWNWLKCGWPPMESDDHYGATLAAIAVGAAPSQYAKTPQASQGMKKLRSYLQQNPGPTLHHRAMVLWAASYQPLLSDKATAAIQRELIAKQQADGGWALASLGDWKRQDGTAQDKTTSDGYGTGFVCFALMQSGLPPQHPAIAKGLSWLQANQRQSGRWFTRSLHSDGSHYITHAGTAMSVMALQLAKEKKTKPDESAAR